MAQNTLLLALAVVVASVNGANILFLVPFPGPSHWILLQQFAMELVNRGHNVTAVVNQPIKNFKSPNYTEVLIDPPLDLTKICEHSQIDKHLAFLHVFVVLLLLLYYDFFWFLCD